MPIPTVFEGRLSIPAIAAPMFIVSGPELVLATCKAGVVGTFPVVNARNHELLDQWLGEIGADLEAARAGNPNQPIAPHGVNLVVHRTNVRLEKDLELTVKHKVPVVVTSVGNPGDIAKTIQDYGGVVFHDVTNIRHAQKAAAAGVDGLILVCSGAGGHAGTMNPFALVRQVREFFDGTIILSGCISDGAGIRAAEALGADLAYLGTRFIATEESQAKDGYKAMLVEAQASDIVYTPSISGLPANFIRQSLEEAGLDPANLPPAPKVDMAEELDPDRSKAWKDIWSAGEGIGSIHDLPSTSDLIARLENEYWAAVDKKPGVSAR
jgi:nitronate monooxygenase